MDKHLYIKVWNGEGVDSTPFPSVQNPARLDEFQFESARMGAAPEIRAELMWPTCLDDEWTDNVFVEFEGEKYFLYHRPSSEKNNDDERWHHSISFRSERSLLAGIFVYDAVEGDDSPASNNTTVRYSGQLDGFIQKLNASLNVSELSSRFVVVVDDGIETDDKTLTFEDKYFNEALSDAVETWGIPYYIFNSETSGKTEIHFGYYKTEIGDAQHPLTYRTEGLTMTKKEHSGNDVINRATGYGSSENLPWYYPNESDTGSHELGGILNVPGQTKVDYNALSRNFENFAANNETLCWYKGYPYKVRPSFCEIFFRDTDVSKTYYDVPVRAVYAHWPEYAYNEQGGIPGYYPIFEQNDSSIVNEGFSSLQYGRLYDAYATVGFIFYLEAGQSIHMEPEIKLNLNSVNLDVDSAAASRYTKVVKISGSSVNIETQVENYMLNRGHSGPVDGHRNNAEINNEFLFTMLQDGQGTDLTEESGRFEFTASENGLYLFEFRRRFPIPNSVPTSRQNAASFTFGLNRDLYFDIDAPHFRRETEDTGHEMIYQDKGYILGIKDNPADGDSLTISKTNWDAWMTPQPNLMPEIYRLSILDKVVNPSHPVRRFYNAKNYPFTPSAGYVPDVIAGEYIDENDGKVYNRYYFNEEGDPYLFGFPFNEKKPVEHISRYDEIKASITGIENSDHQPIDEFLDIAYDEHDNNRFIEDKDGGSETMEHPYFYVKLPKMPFNLFSCVGTEPAIISMTSGICAACKFQIMVEKDSNKNTVQVDEFGELKRDENGNVIFGTPQDEQQNTQIHEVWIALQKDISTYGSAQPRPFAGQQTEEGIKPEVGDKYVITGIWMPFEYILEAERRLSQQIVADVYNNNFHRFNTGIDFSRIYLEENPEKLSKLCDSAKIWVKHNDTDPAVGLYVSSFRYSMTTDALPEITVELADSLIPELSSIQLLESRVTKTVLNMSAPSGKPITSAAISSSEEEPVILETSKGRSSLGRTRLLNNLGLKPKGNSNRPIYLDEGNNPKEVDGIEVPENIRTQKNVEAMWGVAAYGMASLAINGGGGQGTVTAINFEGSPEQKYTPSDGLITLPDYPTAASLISDGLASQDYVASYFASNFTQSNIKNTLGISDWALAASKPSYAFSEITGTASDSQIPTLAISKISGLQTALDGKLATSLKGAANGLAELDANGLVPSSQLPSYVDDVLEYASKSAFPATGETGKIYVALDTNLTWRWSGSAYVEISPSLALGETSSTAYRGDRGKTAYDHATDASRLTTAQSSGFYKFATTAEGHIASVTAVTASDLTTLIGSTTYAPYNADGYLPLSGGTIDADFGALKVKTSNSSSWAGIELLNSNGNSLGYYASSVNNGEPWWVTGGQTAAYPILHSGNYTDYTVQKDGTGASGTWGINITGDADTVDGYHQSDFYRAKMGSLGGVNAADVPVGSHWVYTQLGTSNPVAMTYSSLYTLGRDYYSVQLNVSYNGSRALLRGVAHGSDALTVFNWHELAFLDSNVASATYATSAGNADTVDNEHASAFAHVGTDNNLIAHGNEFNFVPSGYNGDVYVNWRTTGGENGAIRSYYFVDGARNYSPVLFCGGVYKYNYGSSAYVLTSDGGAAAISQMRVGEANGLNPISSAPDNATGNGYDAVTWFSWNLGGIANTSYACGITIGSNPSDPAYGFQIGQELWYDRLYVRRRNSGSWANWKSIAYLDDTVDSANYLVGCTTGTDTGNWDANNPSNKDYLWYYGQDGGVSHAPFANSYGSIVNFFSNGNGSGLNGQLAFGILHDATQNLSTDIWWRAKNNQGWDDRWHRLYDDNHHPLADAATQLQTSRSIWGQSFNGTGDINGNIEIQATGSNFDEGVRIHMASSGFCGVTLCGSDNTGSSGTSANTWSIYNYQGKFGIFQNTSVIDSNNTSGLCGYNGNWGIGTNSPSYKLDVNGSFRAGLVEIPTGQNIINSLSGYALYLNATRSDNVLLAYGGGNVGIGTTSPSYKLHVAGDIYANGGWLRTSGSAGWYSETYGGGWYCDDYTYVKTYGDRSIYTASNILANGNIVANGGVAAGGILNLAYNGAGTQGTLTEIQINGRALTDYSGIVNIPLANTTSTGDGAMSHSDKLKLDGIATGATNVNTDTVAGWGYIKNATGIQNALGYIAARENKKSRLVTGTEYRFQSGDNDCINIWIVSAASVNLYLPYDWDYQTPLRLIIANAYSGSVTVNYKATSGTQKIYSQSDTISLPLGRAALVEMIQFYNASVGGEVTFVTMSSYLQRSIT